MSSRHAQLVHIHHKQGWCLSQVCYKKTDFLGDQILLTGFAPGGLTEVPQQDFKTCSMANTLAQELGPFGFKPEVSPPIVSQQAEFVLLTRPLQ